MARNAGRRSEERLGRPQRTGRHEARQEATGQDGDEGRSGSDEAHPDAERDATPATQGRAASRRDAEPLRLGRLGRRRWRWEGREAGLAGGVGQEPPLGSRAGSSGRPARCPATERHGRGEANRKGGGADEGPRRPSASQRFRASGRGREWIRSPGVVQKAEERKGPGKVARQRRSCRARASDGQERWLGESSSSREPPTQRKSGGLMK
eukprot:8727395-Lingulodinium_polyedra.AAC.1